MTMSDVEFLRLMAEAEPENGILYDGTQARARLLAIAKCLEEIDGAHAQLEVLKAMKSAGLKFDASSE